MIGRRNFLAGAFLLTIGASPTDNERAMQVLGDKILGEMAREIAEKVRRNTTIDWNLRESDRAGIWIAVKRILNLRDYPPTNGKSSGIGGQTSGKLRRMWNREVEAGMIGE